MRAGRIERDPSLRVYRTAVNIVYLAFTSFFIICLYKGMLVSFIHPERPFQEGYAGEGLAVPSGNENASRCLAEIKNLRAELVAGFHRAMDDIEASGKPELRKWESWSHQWKLRLKETGQKYILGTAQRSDEPWNYLNVSYRKTGELQEKYSRMLDVFLAQNEKPDESLSNFLRRAGEALQKAQRR